MMGLRFAGLALGLMLGIIFSNSQTTISPLVWGVSILACAIGTALSLMGLRAEKRWVEWPSIVIFIAAAMMAFAPGAWRTATRFDSDHQSTLQNQLAQLTPNAPVKFRGKIVAEPEWRGNGNLDLVIQISAIQRDLDDATTWHDVHSGRVLLRTYAYGNNSPSTIDHLENLAEPSTFGYQVEFRANYDPITAPLNAAEFDYARFLRQSGIDTRLRTHVARIEILAEDRGFFLTELALLAKTRFLETFKQTVRSPASRIAAAATLGARRSVEEVEYRGRDIAEMFRHAGVGHVLAVSGLHVSVIALLLFSLFRLTGLSPRVFVPPLIFFLILFALLTGARPSSVRAVIMNSVILFTIAYFRCNIKTATTVGLSVSAFFILLVNPLVLFAPSFLLSYGAVLSLLMLAPPFDRMLSQLRGLNAFFFLLWLSLVIYLTGWHLYLLLNPLNLIALLALLGLLMSAGTRLNDACPRLWQYGFISLPTPLRIFVAAQLAIQVGMMIPLSAWFFGRFPVAGILVNLAAIPAVGILVQLGMLLGIIGLIPLVGTWIALPLGAAATLVGELFLLIAWLGAECFPFPATPKPSLLQLGLYYLMVVIAIGIEKHRYRLLHGLYRFTLHAPNTATVRTWTLTLLGLACLLLPWLPKPPQTLNNINILAIEEYPLLTLNGKREAIVINGGDRFDGERLIFDTVRAEGIPRISHAILPSPDPDAGNEGIAALSRVMKIDAVSLPFLPAPAESLTAVLRDDYVRDKANDGVYWATAYDLAFEQLREAAQKHNIRLQPITPATPLVSWSNLAIQALPILPEAPDRFATSADTPLLHLKVGQTDWIVITDTMPEVLETALAAINKADVIITANFERRRTFASWLTEAVQHLQPQVLIVTGDTPLPDSLKQDLIKDNPDLSIWQTAIEGQISTSITDDHISFESYLSGHQRELTMP